MKRLIFVADSHRVLAEFPTPVQRHIGFAPYQAQMGAKHVDAKPWKTYALLDESQLLEKTGAR